jgi:NADPH:quinone reductase-like Zn-dependent oxidoreductase
VVDVQYAGVTFPDVLHTRGGYQRRPELPFTPGWEVSGVVRADGHGFRAGDRVAAMPIVGGFAETVAVDAQMVFALPENVPFDKAAALPLNYLTVHFALTRRARLRSGEIVLVQGAAGGVGSVACQMAAAMGGAKGTRTPGGIPIYRLAAAITEGGRGPRSLAIRPCAPCVPREHQDHDQPGQAQPSQREGQPSLPMSQLR